MTYPLSIEHLLDCPIASSRGSFKGQGREESIKPLASVLCQKDRGEDVTTGHKHCCWPVAFLSSWYLEKCSSFSKVSLALLETVLTTFHSSHPKWLNPIQGCKKYFIQSPGSFSSLSSAIVWATMENQT